MQPSKPEQLFVELIGKAKREGAVFTPGSSPSPLGKEELRSLAVYMDPTGPPRLLLLI